MFAETWCDSWDEKNRFGKGCFGDKGKVKSRPFVYTDTRFSADAMVKQYVMDDYVVMQQTLMCSGVCFSKKDRVCACNDGVQTAAMLGRGRRTQILQLTNLFLVLIEMGNSVVCGYTDPILQFNPTHKCPESVPQERLGQVCTKEMVEKGQGLQGLPLFCRGFDPSKGSKGEIVDNCESQPKYKGACEKALSDPNNVRMCAALQCKTGCNKNCNGKNSLSCGCDIDFPLLTHLNYKLLPVGIKRKSTVLPELGSSPNWQFSGPGRSSRGDNSGARLNRRSGLGDAWSLRSVRKAVVKTISTAAKSATGCLGASVVKKILAKIGDLIEKRLQQDVGNLWNNEQILRVPVLMIKTQKYGDGKPIEGNCMDQVKNTFSEASAIFWKLFMKGIKKGTLLRVASADGVPAVAGALKLKPRATCRTLISMCRTWNTLSSIKYPTYAVPDNQGIRSFLNDGGGGEVFRLWGIRAPVQWFQELTKKYACDKYMAALRLASEEQCHFKEDDVKDGGTCEPGLIAHRETYKDGNIKQNGKTCCVVLSAGSLTRQTCLFYNPYPKGLTCPYVPSVQAGKGGYSYLHLNATLKSKPERLWDDHPEIRQILSQPAMKQHMPELLCKANSTFVGSARHNFPIPTDDNKYPPPICAGYVEMKIMQCTTCCCKKGLITSSAASSLAVNNHPDCSMWFSIVFDYFVRAIMAFVRNLVQVNQMRTCLNKGCPGGPDETLGYCKETVDTK